MAAAHDLNVLRSVVLAQHASSPIHNAVGFRIDGGCRCRQVSGQRFDIGGVRRADGLAADPLIYPRDVVGVTSRAKALPMVITERTLCGMASAASRA